TPKGSMPAAPGPLSLVTLGPPALVTLTPNPVLLLASEDSTATPRGSPPVGPWLTSPMSLTKVRTPVVGFTRKNGAPASPVPADLSVTRIRPENPIASKASILGPWFAAVGSACETSGRPA